MPVDSSAHEQTSEAMTLEAYGEKFHLEIIRQIADSMLDPELVSKLPVEWARAHVMLPVRYQNQLCVLTSDPTAITAHKHLALLLSQELIPLLAPQELIRASIERCYVNSQETAREFLRDLDMQAPAGIFAQKQSDDLLHVAENAPVTQLINLILLESVKAGASDVHIEPYESRLAIRYRIDGVLYEQASPPKHLEGALISRLKVMGHMDIAEKRLPQDGGARVRIGEREIDIRISTIPVAEGERVVLRLLNRNVTLLPLSGLGISDKMLSGLEQLLDESHGIIIVCGPTGSGKTTTLYAALQRLDKQRSNILTIEDPIEYQLPDISQIQVKPKIGLTFATGLRHILRQDPDTILVGEIRDLETAEIAIRASLTGHLVFSTLHTNDAPGAAIRLIDMGVEPYLLADSLRAILAQRLVRRLCTDCRIQTAFSSEEIELLQSLSLKVDSKEAWTAKGCPACLEGYHGRTGLFELMVVDHDIAEMIRQGKINSQKLRALAINNGMTSMLHDGLEKINDGRTSLAEVIRAIGKLKQ